MQVLIAKLNAARVRRETLHGRSYLVVPMTILRGDSVLNGSKGPLFYPRAEVARTPGLWNDVPILVNHPPEGKSGRDVGIVKARGVGRLYGDRVTKNGNRVVQGWFDEEAVAKHDESLPDGQKMLPRLERGEPIEVSTGLYTDDQPARNGSKAPNGRRYTHVARNYRPDHLAVLPTVRGACSVDDGCGVHVENANPEGCNQHTGPGCSGGGSGLSSVAKKFRELGSRDHSDADSLEKVVGEWDAATSGLKPAEWKALAKEMGHEALAGESGKRVKKTLTSYLKTLRVQRMRDSLIAGNDLSENSGLDMTPEKACKIVKDGSVHGKPLTEAQRGMFGAKCGERVKANEERDSESTTNSEEDVMKLTEKKRAAIVASLVANCSCWKGQAETLNEMDDEVLVGLEAQQKELTANQEAVAAVREELGLAEDLVFNAENVTNAFPPYVKKKAKAAAEVEDPEEEMPMKGKAACNEDGKVKKATSAADLSPELQRVVKNAERITNREKAKLTARLKGVAEATQNEGKKRLILNKLKANLEVEELEDLITLVEEPAPRGTQNRLAAQFGLDSDDDFDRVADYSGQGSGSIRTSVDNESLDAFAEESFGAVMNCSVPKNGQANK